MDKVGGKPDHIWFGTTEKIDGKEFETRGILRKEQFAILERSIQGLDQWIEDLTKQRKALNDFNVYRENSENEQGLTNLKKNI